MTLSDPCLLLWQVVYGSDSGAVQSASGAITILRDSDAVAAGSSGGAYTLLRQVGDAISDARWSWQLLTQ